MKTALVLAEIISIIGLLAIAMFVDSAPFASYQRQASANEDYCYAAVDSAEHQKTKECQGLVYKTLDDPVALFTGGLVLFTFGLAIATGWLVYITQAGLKEQAGLTRDALKAADRSSERQLRAYVHVKAAYVRDIHGIAEFWTEYKNFGQTPARNLRHWNIVDYLPYPNEAVFDDSQIRGLGNLGDLGPSHEGHLAKKGIRQLTPDEIRCLEEGSAAVYSWGCFFYEDVFGITRMTNYRHVIGGKNFLSADNRVYADEGGNHAT